MDSTIIGRQNLIVMRVFIAERRSKKLVLRTSRGPSLPYKLQVFSFAKLVILVILTIFASVCFHVA